MDFQNKLASRIRKARELANFTQDYIAIELGISQQQYSQIEKGETKITMERLQKIATLLNTTPEKISQFDEKVLLGNIDCTFNDNSTNVNGIYENHYKELKEIYESRIKDLQTEISYLRSMLEKTVGK